MVTNDTAALRAAAQRLVDAIEDDETPQWRFAQPDDACGAPPSCGGILLETRVEADHHRARRGPRARARSDGDDLDGSAAAARARRRRRGAFQCRERERRLATARIIASDAELIAQAVAAGRVRRLSSRHPNGEPEPQPAARNWKNSEPQ